ncbi:CLUMA_CG015279, isoform A [Clunio marinus]|uniref:CLUMA_CG015279, isoform A n=1 Tax=Clunio marinus TaxID=568069 RepID=A0A1J1ITS0_9DIPT|nr:CLUMA_CG015279, isoform A [Clunio marinus]
MSLKSICVYLLKSFLVLLFAQTGYCIEPISTTLLFGISSGLGIKYFDVIKENTYCRYRECCSDNIIPFNIEKLQDSLENRLFGQHIVKEKLFQAVASHYKKIEKSQKPLVMSFHGSPGTGKNFVSNFIAEAVFEKGPESKFYHVFHGSQYSDSDLIKVYKKDVKNKVQEAVKTCPYSIIVFDEVDKMPEGIFDSIKNLLDHHNSVNGISYRKSIFIFLTNYGAEEITKTLFHLTNRERLYRHDTKLHHFEEINRLGVFNEQGGLKDSHLIKSAVIDFYLPFLPLEERHVTQCIKAEFESFGKESVTKEEIEQIKNYISFCPVTKYSYTGCKTIHPKVKAECL